MNKIEMFNSIYKDIKLLIQKSRANVIKKVNSEITICYYNIGKLIVISEQKGEEKAKYGDYLIKNLSEKLSLEFGRGFSAESLRKYRRFYLNFSSILEPISIQPTVSTVFEDNPFLNHLSWSHFTELLKINENEKREWYMNEALNEGWSVRMLRRNINTQYYDRLINSQIKKPVKDEMIQLNTADDRKLDILKSPTILEFMNIPHSFTEKELESAVLNNIKEFLLELGKGFSFVSRQQLIRTSSNDYYIDLVFYNYYLKCFVLIDLKIGKISHQNVGQMDMYVRMYDDKFRIEGDNPTIGIVLCSETDIDIARYSILKGSEQLFASKYMLYLPSIEELQKEIEQQKKHFLAQFE